MARDSHAKNVGATMLIRHRACVSLVVLFAGVMPLRAQAPDSSAPPAPFFTRRDAILLGGFIAGTVAMVQFDKRLASTFQDPAIQESEVMESGATFFRFMGQPAPQIIGLALYGTGKLAHSTRVQKLGIHGLESMLLANALSGSLKTLAGRSRPCAPCDTWAGGFSDTVPRSFKFLRGTKGRDYQSFPSGHATTAFAAASAVTAETSHWIDESHWWPGWKIVIGTTMYGGAALVGLSRMYHDQHWGSDVVAGAAIGTFSGIKTVSYMYRHPRNRLERWLISTNVVWTGDGETYLAWSVSF